MSVDDSFNQPDAPPPAEETISTEGLPGTEQPQSTPDDVREQVEFFESMGIPIPEELRGAPEPEPEPQPDEEGGQDEQGQPQPQGWKARREGLKKAHQALQEEHNRLQGERNVERQYTNALMQVVAEMEQERRQAPPSQPQAPPEPETEVDLFENPDAYVEQRVNRLLAQRLAPYEKILPQLVANQQQAHVQGAQQAISRALNEERERYTAEDPDYPARAQAFGNAYVSDLMQMGFDQASAAQQFRNEVGAIIQTAIRNGVSPIRSLDIFARRYAGGSAPPPAAQQTAPAAPRRPPVDDQIAAAMRAAQAGASRPGGNPSSGETNDGFTVASLRAGGIKPEQVGEVLRSPGGRGKFFKLLEQAEEADARRR
jgi:hypothetical protein